MREIRAQQQFKQYYTDFYTTAYAEALVGQTTKTEAEIIADRQAKWLAMRVLCQTNLYFLATKIFKLDSARDRTSGRKLWYEPIHGRICDELEYDGDSLIWVSRNALKTTISKVWCVQQILKDPADVRIGMWSMSSDKVRAELKSIKSMLKNKQLVELFPDVLGGKWALDNADALTINRNVGDEVRDIESDEAQIEVWGLESNVTGRHYTHHYYDDMITDKNTTTVTQIEKARDTYGAIQGLMGVGTIEKIVGTPWHAMDLYHYVIDNQLIDKDHILKIPCVTGDLHNEKIIYPFYTKAFLNKQRRKMGDNLYAAQYHLDTTPREGRMFIRPYPIYKAEMFPNDPRYFISVDPSTGRSEKHDKTGLCVAAVSASQPDSVYFVEADSYQLEPEELADFIVKKIIQYQPIRVGIEYGLQYSLSVLIRMKIQEKRRTLHDLVEPEMKEIKTGGGTFGGNKADKINRSIGAMIRDRRAFFLEDMTKLFFQMDAFNPSKQKNDDDIIDAAGMMIQTVEHWSAGNWRYDLNADGAKPVTYYDLFRRKKTPENIRERIFAN